MFTLLSRVQGLCGARGALRLQQLWGQNDDTYDSTDYFM
jgi:hypothetical protein